MTDQHYPTKSVAVLAEQAKVTGWQQPDSNATQLESGVGAEIDALGNAQVVSSTAPGFVPKPDEQLELQKGPKKKYIDGNNQNGIENTENTTEEAGNSNNNNLGVDDFYDAGNVNTDNNDSGFPTDTITDAVTINANDNTGNAGMDDFFAGMDDNDNNNNNKDDGTHPVNATMISLPNVDNGDNDDDDDDNDDYDVITNQTSNDNNNNNNNNNDSYNIDETKEQESSVLGLWQAERRKILEERAQKEKTQQREIQEQANKDREEFLTKRQERINKARENALGHENDIKLDYDSVYKNGTIWEQVAKLVNLQTDDETVKRMRDLIIDLKNRGQGNSK